MNQAPQLPEAKADAFNTGLLRATTLMGALLIAASAGAARTPFIALQFFLKQDLPILIGLAALIFALWRWHPVAAGPCAATLERVRPWQLAALSFLVCAGGVWLVFGGFALSMDEFWAQADGAVLARGAGLVRIADEWRDYAPALQPIFARITPDGWWASDYLPVNATLQYLGGPLASPLLTALAVLTAADLARRLLPGSPSAPALCALLMVSSSQLLVTGMTPYAMNALLALNLAWLWLFLHHRPLAQVAAAAVPILAVGLHQVVFFPLFAAPFLLHAWLARRRAAAAVQGLVIAASFLFWSAYDSVLYHALGLVPVTSSGGGTGTGPALLFTRFLGLLADFQPDSLSVMAINLIRFLTWQNVLLLPLILVALAGFGRMAGVWRTMLGGIVLTIAAMTVLLAFQGHGWGYRYLHGQLGCACLLATYGAFGLIEQGASWDRTRAIIAAGLAVSVLLMPVRAWQAHAFAAPYRAADTWIAARNADVVLVNAPQHPYAVDLVRNDLLLGNAPKRMTPERLSDAQLAALCRRYRVALFTDADAARFGLHEFRSGKAPRALPPTCLPEQGAGHRP